MQNIFTARRVCIARTMLWQDVCLFVCPSVRLSQVKSSSLLIQHVRRIAYCYIMKEESIKIDKTHKTLQNSTKHTMYNHLYFKKTSINKTIFILREFNIRELVIVCLFLRL